MESQPNIVDQNTQPAGQNPVPQPTVLDKPKVNFVAMLATGLVCSLVFGVGGYFLGKQSSQSQKYLNDEQNQFPITSTPTPESSSVPDQITNWKMYTNLDFTFKYPNSLDVGEVDPEYIVRLIDSKLVEKIIIYRGKFADGIDNPNSKFEYSDGKIQNREAKIQKNYSYNELIQISYEFKIKNEDIIMSFIGLDQEVIDQIISSFKFTN